MYVLENDFLKLEVALKGAELKRIFNKTKNEEYMWDSNPEFWGKSSPVLFPHIGGQNNAKYMYSGVEYPGSKHGFARDLEFEFVSQTDDTISFVLKSSDKTLELFPANFEFYLKYTLESSNIIIAYEVVNKDDADMFFSLGTHPAFATPFIEENSYDYYLEFEQEEKGDSYTIDDDGLIGEEKRAVFEGKIVEITENIFNEGAIVLENIKSNYIILKNRKNSNEVKVDLEKFSILTLWAPPKAPFVCIEPWLGINDTKGFKGDISERKGVQKISGKDNKFYAELLVEIK